MSDQTPTKPTSAEDYARRWYRQDHFGTKEGAERAYFRVLSEWLVRGQRITSLSRKLGKARKRLTLVKSTLTARCEALTAERDRLAGDYDYARGELTAIASLVEDRNEVGTYGKVEAALSRCQHLEQAVREALNTVNYMESVYRQNCVSEGEPSSVLDELQLRSAALASLLPAKEETPGTDENRVSFAAGYTTALDDALKGKA